MGDLLHHPSSQIISSAIVKDNLDMKKEMEPTFKASRFSVHFTSFKTPSTGMDSSKLPSKFVFKFRFFTFEEEVTAPMQLVSDTYVDGNKPVINAGVAYYLRRVEANDYIADNLAPQGNFAHQMTRIEFVIDPSQSKIEDEHKKLAYYLKDRYLTIDIFDGVTQFFFGSCKIPLFDLLRQSKQ